MAMKRKPFSQLSKSAKYYRKNKKARNKKAQTDKRINARPEQRKKRSELSVARKKLKKKGIKLNGLDLAHTKRGLVLKSVKANRGSSGDTAGDKRARGKKRKKKKK